MSSTPTLQSNETARVVHVISEGQCGGLFDQTHWAKSVFLDGTALMNASGTYNFDNVVVDQRYGTPNQTYVPGFNSVENVIGINTEVKYGSPITHTTTAANIDACSVTVQLPNGLQKVDDKGNPGTESVKFTFWTKLTSSGTWTQAIPQITISGFANVGYEAQYRLPRPTGTGTWDVKMVRDTPDTTTPNTVIDKTVFYQINEIQEVQETYPNCFLVTLIYDAKTVGNVSATTFDTLGIDVAVPSNYDPVARTYSGIWDGTMSATKAWTFDKTNLIWNDTTTGTLYWTDNPVWCLYDFLTNYRYGLGEFVKDYEIDLASFYSASKWCDQLVTDGAGGTEPRFRFNAQITQAEDSWKILQNFAGTFNGLLLVSNGYITLSVDQPTNASYLVSRSNISSDGFNYTDAASSARKSVARVSWNNPDNAFRQEQAIYSEADPANNIPWVVDDMTAWGCTSHGQALRDARWYVDSQMRNYRSVNFKAPMTAIGLTPGNVIKVADSRFAAVNIDALVVSVSGTTVTLDRPVTIQAGTNTIDCLLADGTTIEERVVTSSAGSTNVLTVASAFSQAVIPGTVAALSGAISVQYFRVTDVSEDTDGWFSINALQYDSTKYSRVETGISVPTPVFSDVTANQVTPDIPTSIAFLSGSSTAEDGTVSRKLTVTWVKPANAASSIFSWRANGGAWNTTIDLDVSTFTIPNVSPGTYDVQITSVSQYGRQSATVSASGAVDLSGASAALIYPVTNLQAQGGGTAFSTPDLPVQWTNPASNAGITPALKDFLVTVYTAGGTQLRQAVVPSVGAGSSASYTYTYSMNQADNGNVPIRSVRIDVQARDGFNNLTAAASQTFTNAAPATITLTSTSGIQNNTIHFTRPTDVDFQGFILWGSTSSTFSLSAATKIYEGSSDAFVHAGLGDSQTWYYKAAAYDSFGKDYTGAGLNVSTAINATTSAGANVNEYQLNGVTWTPNSPSANHVAWTACTAIQTLGAGQGTSWSITAGNAAWTSGILYIYYVAGNTTLSSTTSLSTALASSSNVIVATYRGGTDLEHGDGKAYTDGSLIIAGTVGATALVTGSAVITGGAQIANALIGDAHINGQLSASKINTRGLLVEDASGNVILGAGNALPISYAPSGTLNSNVTINSNGTLSGAGGGAVTPAGISAVGSGNPITSGNVSTYIAGAAIGYAQIAYVNANQVAAASLSAITATIGTLRTASSGGRTEISDNVISVYDTTNALRVKIGYLS